MLATIADLKEKATPPQYVLCGTERYKALMQELGLDPDTPEGEHTLNEARKKAVYTGRDSNLVPAASYFGIRVVVSDLVPPDFIQVLPDPVFVLRQTEKKPSKIEFLWLQCSQCGWGQRMAKAEAEVDEWEDGSACPHCGVGPIRSSPMGRFR